MFNRTLEIFREICAVPHGSGNTERLSEYCCDFAEKNGLRHIRDELGDVIIFKNGQNGGENAPAVILQGHLDMVCVKDEQTEIDFLTDGLSLCEDEDFIWAKGTSLGGDDGIAVAYALAILESGSLTHPPLEIVLTVDEETGMFGAEAIDMTPLSGRMLINMDSEEEGTVLAGCAGGLRLDASLKMNISETAESTLTVALGGLSGGHSGTEIHKGRLNGILALARLLSECKGIRLASLAGGNADNAIPDFCTAVISCTDPSDTKKELEKAFDSLSKACRKTDPDIYLKTRESGKSGVLSEDETAEILSLLAEMPNGVTAISKSIASLVQTSLNLGVAKTEKGVIGFHHSIRSSVDKEKDRLCERVRGLYENAGFYVSLYGEYPAWEYRENSRLRDAVTAVYKKQSGKDMTVAAIHAGLECGMFCGKMPELDCVSIGQDIFDIHSCGERLSKKSAERVLKLVIGVLAELS